MFNSFIISSLEYPRRAKKMIRATVVAEFIASKELWDGSVAKRTLLIISCLLLNKYHTADILIIAPLPILVPFSFANAHFTNDGEKGLLK